MVEMIPSEFDRVRHNTSARTNLDIDRRIEHNIHVFSSQPDFAISSRIEELESEWDVERIIETNASSLVIIGTALGAFLSPWFLLIPAIVGSFLLLHAIQGWCPPVPILRAMGKRTRQEIDVEKFAMKALRGDFDGLSNDGGDRFEFANRVIEAVRNYSMGYSCRYGCLNKY